MRSSVLSNCERNFILRAASELKRLDGRRLECFRDLNVVFGNDWGLCHVSLGDSKVLTQVTCDIQEPKTTKPNEGLLFINVELSSMASPHFEPGRISNLGIHINRLLEKCIKDSRAVDLESLCIVAEEKAWVLKVDVNILNHDGSLVDCASISALAALAHFKRPDVTTDGAEIKVHSISERDPIPITLHHYPICVSFALLNNSERIFADPTAIEERVSDASLTFGINAYKEICCLHLGGTALVNPKLILSCSRKAAVRAKEVVNIINEALKKDAEERQLKQKIGFVNNFKWNETTSLSEGKLQIQLSKYKTNKSISDIKNLLEDDIKGDIENFKVSVNNLGENCAELNITSENGGQPKKNINRESTEVPLNVVRTENIGTVLCGQIISYGEGGGSKWKIDVKTPVDVNSDSDADETVPVQPKKIENIDLCDDSEEDEVVVLKDLDAVSSTFKVKNKEEKGTQNFPEEKGKKNKKRKRNKPK